MSASEPVSAARRQAKGKNVAKRCKARMPKRVRGIWPGGRCGLIAGHDGAHTLLVPTGYPWAKAVKQ